MANEELRKANARPSGASAELTARGAWPAKDPPQVPSDLAGSFGPAKDPPGQGRGATETANRRPCALLLIDEWAPYCFAVHAGS